MGVRAARRLPILQSEVLNFTVRARIMRLVLAGGDCMKRRYVVIAVALVLLILGGSYTTVRARQVSSEHEARIMSAAQAAGAKRAIRNAASAGLTASELAPLRAAETRLAG